MDCRILYVVGQLRAGGLERQLCYLLEAMDRDYYRPELAVWNFSEDDYYVPHLRKLVRIHFPPRRIPGLMKLKWIRSLARRLNPEVIHSYSFYTNFSASYAATGTDAITVGSLRSDFLRAIKESGTLLGWLCARWPRSQIVNSIVVAQSLSSFHRPFVPKQLFLVKNALDLHRFARTPFPNGSEFKLLGIGSLLEVKRWDRLLKAAYRLNQQGLDFVVKIVGDGPLRASLLDQAKALGLERRVEFIGQRDDIPTLLSKAALLVHTSDSEGRSNVIMEAMACGRPVVATDTGDTRYLVDDGRTGFVVPNGDEVALASSIATLINNRTLCVQMGEAARAKADREFALERIVTDTFGVYRALGWNAS